MDALVPVMRQNAAVLVPGSDEIPAACSLSFEETILIAFWQLSFRET